jgi:periplasmic protein TonB
MTRRRPAALLTVLALHLALAWALVTPGSGRSSMNLTQPLQTTLMVHVTLLSTTRPAPAKPTVLPPAAPKDLRVPGGATERHVPAVSTVIAPPPAASPDTGSTLATTDPTEEQRPQALAQPPAAGALAAPAIAALAAPTPTRAHPTPEHAAPLVVAHADRQRCPPAPHPAALRERGIEGAVLLRVKVDTQGRPADVQVQSGSGWRLFDEAALQQVRACRFVPATQGGQAIDSWVEFPVRFALAG